MAREINRGHCASHSHDCPSDCPDRLILTSSDVDAERRSTHELDGDVRNTPDASHVNYSSFDKLTNPDALGTMDEDEEVQEVADSADERDERGVSERDANMPHVDGFPE